MKVIIAGCRNIPFRDAAELIVQAMLKSGWQESISEIVHGGAKGVDSAAQYVCQDCWPVKVFKADWEKHGKSAGPIRNRKMAQYSDALIAIWDGKSPGTESMIDIATNLGLKVFVYRIDSKETTK